MTSQHSSAVPPALARRAAGIDHLAIAVEDLDAAIEWYANGLGFSVAERRETQGDATGMISAVLRAGGVSLVLVQGTSSESQISRFVAQHGPGVQHVALRVEGIDELVSDLRSSGVEFETEIVGREGLRQIFVKRDPRSGIMLELIERRGVDGFDADNVRDLFCQVERRGSV